MKTINIINIIMYIGAIMLFIGLIWMLLEQPKLTTEEKQVPCYDKYGNEIMNTICKDKVYTSSGHISELLMILGFIIIIITPILGIIYEIYNIEKKGNKK